MSLVLRPLLVLMALMAGPAAAITGGGPAPSEIADRSAMIVSTRGAACSSAVIGADLLLTAAHCVEPRSDYAVVVFEPAGPRLVPVVRVAIHPRYSANAYLQRRPTPDLALVKLASPLPGSFRPAPLGRDLLRPAAGDRFLVSGYGMTTDSDPRSAGRLHAVELPVIGNTIDATGIIMMRLGGGDGTLAGACDGDSGGPVWGGGRVVALVSWRKLEGGENCGTVTGATLVAPQLDWIEAMAAGL